MPEIKAFRGWRYNTEKVNDFSKVLAPPYDVISPRQQEKLYSENPCNVIRLELGKEQPGDNEFVNKYSRADGSLENWKKSSDKKS